MGKAHLAPGVLLGALVAMSLFVVGGPGDGKAATMETGSMAADQRRAAARAPAPAPRPEAAKPELAKPDAAKPGTGKSPATPGESARQVHHPAPGVADQLSIRWVEPQPAPQTPQDAPVRFEPGDAEGLDAFFAEQGFLMSRVREGSRPVPRVYVTKLPGDLKKLARAERRKELFLRTVLPLILMSNEELSSDRGRLLALRERQAAGDRLTARERSWLAGLAERYETGAEDLDALLLKVDEVPVSLALGQAILESGWGTSRFAVQGNALFGERVFSAKADHLVKRDGSQRRFRAFPDLMESVRAYMHNLNSHPAYRGFRKQRAAARAEGRAPSGKTLLPTLERYAELPEYLTLVRSLIRGNRLGELESARLDRQWFADRSLNF